MNRVLFKAAAIVNIAAAALIYVACSGDDGKDGAQGTSCNAVVNTVSGGYDIVCGGVVAGNIKDGAPGPQGPPGTATTGACTGTQVATGIAITCNGEFVGIVTNGEPGPAGPAGPGGGGGTGACAVDPYKVNSADNGIKINCGTGIVANLITCPKETRLIEYFAVEKFCDADGYVKESASATCAGQKFNPNSYFCQRTSALGADLTTNVDADQEKHEADATVKSELKPLCGGTLPTPSSGDAWVIVPKPFILGGAITARGQYSSKERCTRNLISDTNTVNTYNAANNQIANGTSGAGNYTLATPGGASDLNPAQPWSGQWAIYTDTTNCFAKSLTADQITAHSIGIDKETTCAFYSAETSPLTRCPAAKPVVSIDDIACVARNTCTYHSAVDNSCYVKDLAATVGKPGQFTINKSGSGPSATYTVGGTIAAPEKLFAITPLEFSTLTNTTKANKWAKICTTLTRTVYYAANDKYLASKAVVEGIEGTGAIQSAALAGLFGEAAGTSLDVSIAPVCAKANTATGTEPSNAIPAAAFDDAFKCLNSGILSNYVTGNRHDGSSHDRAIYCVGSTGTIGTPTPTACATTPTACGTAALCEAAGHTWEYASGTAALTITGIKAVDASTSDNCAASKSAIEGAINSVSEVSGATITLGTLTSGECAITGVSATVTISSSVETGSQSLFDTVANNIETALNALSVGTEIDAASASVSAATFTGAGGTVCK